MVSFETGQGAPDSPNRPRPRSTFAGEARAVPGHPAGHGRGSRASRRARPFDGVLNWTDGGLNVEDTPILGMSKKGRVQSDGLGFLK